jgi:tetratricopeptide (TPR) repeat protein
LCGNCHVAIKGNELAHADDLKRRQLAFTGGDTVIIAKDMPSEAALRERAVAEPSNAEAAQAWFGVADDQAVADFYDQNREESTQNLWLCGNVAGHLKAIGRWQDVITVADRAMEISEREGTLEAAVESIASWKGEAMWEIGRGADAIPFLQQLVTRFPKSPVLHGLLSTSFQDAMSRAITVHGETTDSPEIREAVQGYVRHTLEAAQLAPSEWSYALKACFARRIARQFRSAFALDLTGDCNSALEYGKRAYDLASSHDQRSIALQAVAGVYMSDNLYAVARHYLRQALQIDEFNVAVVTEIAKCFLAEGNEREAIRMAQRGLMLDPENQDCKRILNIK